MGLKSTRPTMGRDTRYLLIVLMGFVILVVAGALLFRAESDRIALDVPEKVMGPVKPSVGPSSASSPRSRPVQPSATRQTEGYPIETYTSNAPIVLSSPLATDPELRSRVLNQIRTQKEREYAGIHGPWIDAQNLSDEGRSALIAKLVDHDVWVAAQLMPEETIMTPSDAENRFDLIAEERLRLIAAIGEEIGVDIAESYELAFPGPEPGRFGGISDDMPPMPPPPAGFVPEQIEKQPTQLPATR